MIEQRSKSEHCEMEACTLRPFQSHLYTTVQQHLRTVSRRSFRVRNLSIIAMGVEKEIVRPGSGLTPVKGQKVTVHCTGYGKNRDLSQKFWSTKDPGQKPFEFNVGLGSVIKGWDEGVMGMKLGEVAKLKCTPDYAYGAAGFQAWGIQPNSHLTFEIEVLKIQ